LYHHVTDVDNLRDCYSELPKDKAVGVDGVTKEEYGKHLEENLVDLSSRLKRMGYKPQPKLRRHIPKPGSDKGRPLGISCFEDKIVELSVKKTLEPIYEAVFEDSSYGYRPGRSQHNCLDALGKTIQQKRINFVVEADVRSFFDRVNHSWMVQCVEHRIGDPRVIRLIKRMLKGGIVEDGLVKATEEGTPQGSILSPLLSNIYLHYVLDVWFKQKIQKHNRGESYFFRFADDFLACFQHRDEALRFLEQLQERLKKFDLEVANEKTHCIAFGRYARQTARACGEKPKEFTFLGFTHYCGKTKNGYFKVKRRTSSKKMKQSIQKFTEWIKKARGLQRTGEILRGAKRRIIGHLNYYAITDNSKKCNSFVYRTQKITLKWLNRRSQRKTYTWEGFKEVLRQNKWPKAVVRKDLNPCCRAEAH
jgi:group II intron reverse transcriptase/maturase